MAGGKMFLAAAGKKPVFSKKQTDAIEEIAAKQFAEEVERKYQVQTVEDTQLQVAPTSSGDVSTVGNYIPLLTAIDQSTSGSAGSNVSERIGNEIILKSLKIDIITHFIYDTASGATGKFYDGNLGVRFLILRQRDQNTANGVIGNWKGTDLLKGAAGPKAWTGTPTDLHCPINLDAYAVIHDRKTVMYNNKISSGTDGAFVEPGDFKKFTYNFKLGKNGKKLKFVDDSATFSTNFPYIGVLLYCGMYGGTVPSNQLLSYNTITYAQYTDA